ncbi:hypothetical protein ACUXCC_002283 [Cytobacillus horneckiae]
MKSWNVFRFVLENLRKLGVRESELGVPLDNLPYSELEYELVLALFSKIDVEKSENGWF